jgi:uncharacterized protein (TIGR03437 family)
MGRSQLLQAAISVAYPATVDLRSKQVFPVPKILALDNAGNLYIGAIGTVRKVSLDGIITTVAGPAFGNGDVNGIAADIAGNIYISDRFNGRVRRVSPSGTISVIAGSGGPCNCELGTVYGYSGDGGPATGAQLNPYGLAVDTHGSIYVADPLNNAIRVLQPLGPISAGTVVNAGSNIAGSIAPGEVVIINGSGLGPAELVSVGADARYETRLAGTSVQFNGTPATLIYTWATQVAAVVPNEISGPTARVEITYQDQAAGLVTVPVATSAPGLFTVDSSGKGQAAAVNNDGSVNGPSNPAKAGSTILLYATGAGQTSPTTGVQILPVSVTIGSHTVSGGVVTRAIPGVIQIRTTIPTDVQTGSAVPVTIHAGDVYSQAGVTIAVQ